MVNKQIKIAGIGGSLEKKSATFAALKFTMEESAKLGADIIVYDIAKFDLPIYNPSKTIEDAGGNFKEFLNEIHSADGYIFASPEYHGSVSGAFKNVMDFLEHLADYDPPYLLNKPAGCIAVGGGEDSGITTIQTMVNIVHNFKAITPYKNVVISPANKFFNSDKEISSDIVKRRLTRLANEVYTLAIKLSANS